MGTVDTETTSLSLADDLPTTEADPDRLRRLFEDPFRNAVGHGSTDSRTGSSDGATDDGVQVRVGCTEDGSFVGHDGPGVPAEERSRVFDPGYSPHGADGGTGLGMTIVERIARARDWSVSVTGGLLGGARFEFHQRGEARSA